MLTSGGLYLERLIHGGAYFRNFTICPMSQFGPKHVCIEDVHIFNHCDEMARFLLWIGTYCISCVLQQTSGVKDLSSLVRYDDSCVAAIRHVQSIIPVVRPRPIYAPTASCSNYFQDAI